MEEIEKSKVIRTRRTVEPSNSAFMTAIAANTIREIVKLANENNIKRENIVSLLKENGQFVLVFYK